MNNARSKEQSCFLSAGITLYFCLLSSSLRFIDPAHQIRDQLLPFLIRVKSIRLYMLQNAG